MALRDDVGDTGHLGRGQQVVDSLAAEPVGDSEETVGLSRVGTFVEGEFLDTVCGIPDSRTEIVMLKPPDDGTRLELSSFVRPDSVPGSPDEIGRASCRERV